MTAHPHAQHLVELGVLAIAVDLAPVEDRGGVDGSTVVAEPRRSSSPAPAVVVAAVPVAVPRAAVAALVDVARVVQEPTAVPVVRQESADVLLDLLDDVRRVRDNKRVGNKERSRGQQQMYGGGNRNDGHCCHRSLRSVVVMGPAALGRGKREREGGRGFFTYDLINHMTY